MEEATGGNEMRKTATPILICWSMIWRATILAPLCFFFQVIVVASWIARFFLPVLICIAAFFEDWMFLAVYLFAWILSIALWRWQTFRNMMEFPPAVL